MATERRLPATAPQEAAGGTGRAVAGTVGDALEEAARQWGAVTALVASGEDGARRTWSFAELRDDAKRVARALLQRYRSAEHVAIRAANLPQWPLVEFGAALAGLTLVTVNPAYRAAELTHVLRQSRASGILVQPHYRGTDLVKAVESVRPVLPVLRDVIDLSRWDAFLVSAGERAAGGRLRGDRPDPVHVRDDRLPEGRDAPAPRPGGREPAVRRGQRGGPGGRVDQPDADVPHRRVRPGHPGGAAERRHARAAGGPRPGTDAGPVPGRAAL